MDNKEPKLLAFSPCERVIVGEQGESTLVAILQGFEIEVGDLPPQTDVPPSELAMLPLPWYVFVLWQADTKRHKYVQRFELRDPNDKPLMTGLAEFSFDADDPKKRFHRLVARLPGIPLRGFGDYRVVLFLKTDDGEFVERGSFPFPINPKKVD